MYVVRSKRFDKQYKKLPMKTQRQFGNRLKLFLDGGTHPLLHVHDLIGKYQGLKSFNVTGDVRAIFEIQGEDTVLLSAIGSHSELYSQ